MRKNIWYKLKCCASSLRRKAIYWRILEILPSSRVFKYLSKSALVFCLYKIIMMVIETAGNAKSLWCIYELLIKNKKQTRTNEQFAHKTRAHATPANSFVLSIFFCLCYRPLEFIEILGMLTKIMFSFLKQMF